MCDSIWSHYHYASEMTCIVSSGALNSTHSPWNGHCACAVSRDLSPGAKMIHIFEIPDYNFPIHFVTFRELRRRLSYRWKIHIGKAFNSLKLTDYLEEEIAFFRCEGYKVYYACAVSRELCIGVPKTTRNNFLTRIVYLLYNFNGATMSIKSTFILEHLHVKAIFGRIKNEVQSKSVHKMAVFRKFKSLNIKYSYRDTQKALPYPERRLLTSFA